MYYHFSGYFDQPHFVIEALSQRSMDFQNTVEFQIEYEEYLQNRS
jgi:hypothetical protein